MSQKAGNGEAVAFFRKLGIVAGGIAAAVTVIGMFFGAVTYVATAPIRDQLDKVSEQSNRADSIMMVKLNSVEMRQKVNRGIILDLAEVNLYPEGSPRRQALVNRMRANYERITRGGE